ncbi:MAG: hypothetical protein HRT58_03955 [Crocinitomicaceae bacterium]|nr:hypothetical protein [Flavobacteriales bacterium]NQZ34789.1 hypothetical protein [Crocinitomicaceae bacterium]
MKVKILEVSSDELTKALIRVGEKEEMPSIQDDWVFNFRKHSNNHDSKAYVLVHEDTPNTIEGCMIFSIHTTFGPFMDFLEVAPHNKGNTGKYKYVAGCLIAYACGLSFDLGSEENKGILTFFASGETHESTEELEKLYRKKYKAKKNPFGFMEIYQEESKELIEEYLNRE